MQSVDPQSVQAAALLKSSLPNDWPSVRLKFLLAAPITDGPHLTPEFTTEGFPFLSVDGIQNGELVFEECRYVSEENHHEFSKKAAPQRDDILLGKAASTGKIARVKVDTEFSIWSPLALIRADTRKVSSAFLEHCLKSTLLQSQIDDLCSSNTQKNIRMGDIPRLTLPLPSLDVQLSIANYLDRETARIDGLIAEKQHMLALLEEKRAALISRVVTRGLDHNAPLKPSGQEWLGDIPAHWEIWKLKYVVSKIGSGVTPRGGAESYQSEGIPLLRSQNIHFDGLRMDDVVFVDAEMHESMENSKVQDGDVLLNITGASIGRCFYIENMNGEVNVNQHVCIVRPSSQIQTKFLYFTLRSNIGQTQIDLSQSGSGREGLNFEALGNFSMPVPSVNEQIAITEYLEATGQRSHLLLSEVRNSIDRLKERRAALITAAVTGQIPLNEMQNLTKEPSCASIV